MVFVFSLKKRTKLIERTGKNVFFLMATPRHGNMGDHAIVNAQYEFLDDIGCSSQIVEISNLDYLKYKSIIARYITYKDVIIIDGGGNLGVLWPNEDTKISEIISTYLTNRIIIFPQTCYYDETENSQNRLQHNRIVYNKHTKLTIALRDKKSFDFFQKHFPRVDSIFVPDIVLYSNFSKPNIKREGVLLCFRQDLEKVVPAQSVLDLKVYLKDNDYDYRESDTVIDRGVGIESRKSELNNKLEEFSESSLVITDRLHGLIFAVITGTPCIAMDNVSKKVSGVASWILDRGSVLICNDTEEINDNILSMYGKHVKYDNSDIKDKLNVLAEKFPRQ